MPGHKKKRSLEIDRKIKLLLGFLSSRKGRGATLHEVREVVREPNDSERDANIIIEYSKRRNLVSLDRSLGRYVMRNDEEEG